MKWKNKAKHIATTTSAILLAIMLTACGNNAGTNETTDKETGQLQQGSIPQDSLPDESGMITPGALTDDTDNDTGKNEDIDSNSSTTSSSEQSEQPKDDATTESAVKRSTGIYVGAIDSHSIEVETADGVIVLQIGEEFQYLINEFPSDQKVTFEYTVVKSEDHSYSQNWLKSLTEVQ